MRPIRQFGDRAAAIARGDFRAVASATRRRDRDLAISINQMSEQLGQYELEVRRHEHFAPSIGWGRAWPINSAMPPPADGWPSSSTGEMRRGQTSDRSRSPCGSCDLMESYLQRFMVLGRDQPLAAENVCLSTVVEDALSLVRPACVHAGIDLEFSRRRGRFRSAAIRRPCDSSP